MKVLVVEDERHLAEGIRENLLLEGYEVDVANDGDAGLQAWQAGGVDLIVLDVMLPKRDGFDVCETIRAQGGMLPILFLTAKNASDDRVRGLQAGGDDYLGKPFDLRELLLRVQVMLRRQGWYAKPPTPEPLFNLAHFKIDFRTYEVFDAEGHVEHLPQKEIMIFKMLVEHHGEVVSRDDILNHVWGYDVFPSSRTVDNFIVRLRKRFEPDPAAPRHFHTVRGVGYRFTQDPQHGEM